MLVSLGAAVADLAERPGGAGKGGALVGFRVGLTAAGRVAQRLAGLALVHGGLGGAFRTAGAGFALSLAMTELVLALEPRREPHPLPQPQPRLPPAT